MQRREPSIRPKVGITHMRAPDGGGAGWKAGDRSASKTGHRPPRNGPVQARRVVSGTLANKDRVAQAVGPAGVFWTEIRKKGVCPTVPRSREDVDRTIAGPPSIAKSKPPSHCKRVSPVGHVGNGSGERAVVNRHRLMGGLGGTMLNRQRSCEIGAR